MTSFLFHSKISSSTDGDQNQTQISSFSLGTSSTSTSPSPPLDLFDSQQHDHKSLAGALHHEEIKGSTCCNYGIQRSSPDHHPEKPVKWMSSKMRIMRKMINSYQTPITKPRRCNNHHLQDQKKANQESIIRVCSDCNTTKTPLWRSGPCGPKSLCNACGIRQRKARRAMAASAVKDNVPSGVDRTMPFKKRCRFAAASVDTARERKLCFEDIVVRLSKSSAFHRVFPQDEKDAAILLMALSSGLLCSS